MASACADVKVTFRGADYTDVVFLFEFIGNLLWWWPSKAVEKYQDEQSRARQRERVFLATHEPLAQMQQDQARVRSTDYFGNRPHNNTTPGT
jgi:hypothetical protein